MVALANRLHVNPWFTMPHVSDDGFIRSFAQLVHSSLDRRLKVYVEYSNEVWNTVFPQTEYAKKKGLELRLSSDPDEAMIRWYARRSKEVFSIWETAFEGRQRLVRVFATNTYQPEYDEIPFKTREYIRGGVDAIAIGAYFGGELGTKENIDRVEKMTLDELFRELETVHIPDVLKEVARHVEVGRRYGVPIIAYEGGQHLAAMAADFGDEPLSPKINALFDAANRDPRMGLLYWKLVEGWSRITGGQLFVHLENCSTVNKNGRWGLLEYLEQPRTQAPKYDAVQRWMEGAPPPPVAWRK